MNAKTTPRSLRKGAEEMFLELLEQYQIPKNLFPLVELQLKKLFHHFISDIVDNEIQLQSQMTTIQNQIKQLKIRFGLNQIDKETYEITLDLSNQVLEINKEFNSENGIISNLEELISQSLKKLSKLSTV